jgi:hypothetical protein
VGEARRNQAVQRLADLELDHAGVIDELPDIASAIDHWQQPLLLHRERRSRLVDVLVIDRENQIKRRDLLFDQAPFIHPPGALEQQRFGADPDQEVLALGPDPRLEVEGP